MSKVLLDTDILSEILKGKNATVMKRAAEYLAAEGRYTTTVLSVMEVVRGFYRIGAVDRADQFASFLSTVEPRPLRGCLESRSAPAGGAGIKPGASAPGRRAKRIY